MALPFLALYLNGQLGVSMTEVGLVLLVSSAIGATGNIVGGEIADKFSRKRIMGMALGGRAVMMVLIAAVITFVSGYLIIAVVSPSAPSWGRCSNRPLMPWSRTSYRPTEGWTLTG